MAPPVNLNPPEGRGPFIAVVGGGASGTLVALHLLHSAAAQQCPLRVALIDRHGRHGLGQAYGTTHPDHLLNAPAAQMSALAGDPDHLARWAAAAGIADAGFLPRHVYGRYLRETLWDAERQAQPFSRVTQVTSDAVAIRRNARGRPLRLLLADGCIDADMAVLAIGNLPPVPPTRCCVTSSAVGWPGQIRCGSASTLTPPAPCSTRLGSRAAPSSRLARRCGGSGTRQQPSRRSPTRRPSWPAA